MEDANPIRTLGDYSKPSDEGYMNTIELPEGNNVVPLRSDTIRANRERTRMHLFQFYLRDQARNWLERLPVGFITTWEDLTTRFLTQFFPLGRTAKLPRIALMQPTQVNKITSSCEICSGPHDTQYCMENPEQAFVEYASLRTDEAEGKWYTFKPEQNNFGDTYNPSWKSLPNLSQSNLEGLVSNFMASQDTRLSKFEANFKQHQSEMTNKINTVLKAITNRMAEELPSDTVKNPKLNVNSTSPVLFARSYPIEDPQCSTHIHGSINTITVHPKQQSNSYNDKSERGPCRNNEQIEWLDVEEPLDLVNISEESVYESLIKEMPICSLNYDFRIKKGDPRNLKIPCMIGHKFTANAYIDVDLPMNIMSLTYYNSIRKNGYEYGEKIS
ncbi:MAK10-like protein [Tanacetum coccineum]